ncbi:MAG: hypothetical protein WD060_03330 [Pirellulales bacterium]
MKLGCRRALICGTLSKPEPASGDLWFELVVGALGNGMSNFRVIPGDVRGRGSKRFKPRPPVAPRLRWVRA